MHIVLFVPHEGLVTHSAVVNKPHIGAQGLRFPNLGKKNPVTVAFVSEFDQHRATSAIPVCNTVPVCQASGLTMEFS